MTMDIFRPKKEREFVIYVPIIELFCFSESTE